MTTEALPEFVYDLGKVEPDGLVKAINRLAQAIEQATLAKLDVPQAVPQAAPLASLPPVRLAPETALGTVCPIHNQPWKWVPPGISKKNGNAYDGFHACPIRGCDQRPR